MIDEILLGILKILGTGVLVMFMLMIVMFFVSVCVDLAKHIIGKK